MPSHKFLSVRSVSRRLAKKGAANGPETGQATRGPRETLGRQPILQALREERKMLTSIRNRVNAELSRLQIEHALLLQAHAVLTSDPVTAQDPSRSAADRPAERGGPDAGVPAPAGLAEQQLEIDGEILFEIDELDGLGDDTYPQEELEESLVSLDATPTQQLELVGDGGDNAEVADQNNMLLTCGRELHGDHGEFDPK